MDYLNLATSLFAVFFAILLGRLLEIRNADKLNTTAPNNTSSPDIVLHFCKEDYSLPPIVDKRRLLN